MDVIVAFEVVSEGDARVNVCLDEVCARLDDAVTSVDEADKVRDESGWLIVGCNSWVTLETADSDKTYL